MLSKILINQGVRLSLVLASAFAASAITTVAQAEDTPPAIFGDITIGRNFAPNPQVRGMSGGSVPARKVAGRRETPTGPCTGYFDRNPDHTIQLTNKFEYLKLQIQSPADTTLLVSGPGGNWCNDDFNGKNPGIVGEWLPGTYNVWIGSYQRNKYFPYTLQITEVK